jgi:hypothetical protein
MRHPLLPNDLIRTDIIEARGLKVSQAEKALKVSRKALLDFERAMKSLAVSETPTIPLLAPRPGETLNTVAGYHFWKDVRGPCPPIRTCPRIISAARKFQKVGR